MVQFLISIYNLIIVSLALNTTSDELKNIRDQMIILKSHILNNLEIDMTSDCK